MGAGAEATGTASPLLGRPQRSRGHGVTRSCHVGRLATPRARVMPTRKEDIASAKAKATWQPDSEAASCTKCGAKFTVVRRRHHCRLCGGIFCASCSEARATRNFDGVILAKPQRACMDCYAELRRKPVGWGSGSASASGAGGVTGPEPEPQPHSDEESDANSSVEAQSDSGDSSEEVPVRTVVRSV